MNEISPDSRSRYVSDVIQRRLDRKDFARLASGWHRLLGAMLDRFDPFMTAGHLVTFQRLTSDEKSLFESIHARLSVPDHCGAIYLPPSVIESMIAAHPDGGAYMPPTKPSDAGALLVSKKTDFRVIVNAVLGLPPFMPAVDVYEDGRMIAGYIYKTIETCVMELSTVLAIHLGVLPNIERP